MSPDVPTFLSIDGHSIFDLILVSLKVEAALMRQYIDDEMDLFTRLPRIGHVPVLSALV